MNKSITGIVLAGLLSCGIAQGASPDTTVLGECVKAATKQLKSYKIEVESSDLYVLYDGTEIALIQYENKKGSDSIIYTCVQTPDKRLWLSFDTYFPGINEAPRQGNYYATPDGQRY